jgi:hypothetical protein
MRRRGQRGHLRDVATICPATTTLSSGTVLNRCELDKGHPGKHKDGCTRWGGIDA